MHETLPAIISQVTSDLAECFNCVWAVGFGPDLCPLHIIGDHPDLDLCIGYLAMVLAGQHKNAVGLSTFERLPHDWVPSVVCPIHTNGENLGVLALGPRDQGQAYTRSDRDLIDTLAAQIAILMRDERLSATIGKRIVQVRRSHAELESARQVQNRFFPLNKPPVNGLDYDGECQQVGQVGGDFFDFIAADSTSLLLSVGDVSGKGIPAAIIMAGIQASLRALKRSTRFEIPSLLGELNDLVWRVSPDNFFASMFCAQIDCTHRELHYVNAGHEPPLLINQSGALKRLEPTGRVLGITTRSTYQQATVRVQSGDVLVVTTDGITEALDVSANNSYEEVVLRVLRDHPFASSSDVVWQLLREVNVATGKMQQHDDRTVVAVRVTDSPVAASIRNTSSKHAIAYAVAGG